MLVIQCQSCEPNLVTCTRDVLRSNRLHIGNFLTVVLILGKQSEDVFRFLSHHNNLKFFEQGYVIYEFT